MVGLELKSKICSLPKAKEIVAAWFRDGTLGSCIGFANGVFEILHKGHLRALMKGRGTCDRRIVAINRDSSVKRLKGKNRQKIVRSTKRQYLKDLKL
jgi:D-beta-D-heptose 7-phosphate kinase/D-beta-D-heptose 1-phosphate adenosyltransferase